MHNLVGGCTFGFASCRSYIVHVCFFLVWDLIPQNTRKVHVFLNHWNWCIQHTECPWKTSLQRSSIVQLCQSPTSRPGRRSAALTWCFLSLVFPAPHLSLDQTNQRTKVSTGRPQVIAHPEGLGCSLKTLSIHHLQGGDPVRWLQPRTQTRSCQDAQTGAPPRPPRDPGSHHAQPDLL